MDSLQDDKFDRIKLMDRHANISGELAPTFIKDTTLLKQLTGGDMISSRLMHSQKDVKFMNFAKLIFLANKIPGTYENDDAYFERVKLFNFPHVFKKGVDRDEYILEKISTSEEFSGLFNRAVEALRKLLERGDFTTTKSSEELKDEYITKSNPIMHS